MKYEKSLMEVLQWKEDAGNELYNLTIRERLEFIRKSEKRRKRCNSDDKKSDKRVQQMAEAHRCPLLSAI
jgi:hypothetical protein